MTDEFHTIECTRVRLRRFAEADLPAFVAYRADPDVAQYQSWSVYTLTDAEDLYRDIAGKAFGLSGEWYQIAIAELESDRLLGDLALHFMGDAQVEVGFTLAPVSQGRGLGREALDALMGYVFATLAIRRAIAIVDARNRPAIRLLETCGFTRLPGTRTVAFKGAVVEEFVFECLAGPAPAGSQTH